MTDFQLCGWLLSYDLSKILAKLVISLKHNIIFAKLLEILLNNNVTSSHTHIRLQSKNIRKLLEFIFSDFLLKALTKMIFKMHWKNSTHLGLIN